MTVTNPPKLAAHLLRWYCERAQIDDLEGDIEELFHLDVKRSGVAIAKLNYWRRTVSLIFSYAITKRKRDASYHHFSNNQLYMGMFKNYFTTATRNLKKNLFF